MENYGNKNLLMGWTIKIVSVKSYLATTIVLLPLYFPNEKLRMRCS